MEVSGGLKQSRGGLARRFPARRVSGGGEKVGENGEGLEFYLWAVLERGMVARGGRRWLCSPAAMLLWDLGGAAGH